MNIPVLTIDGPSGAGKGTVSRAVANCLGWHYLDSGSIYRSLAIAMLDQAIDLNNQDAAIQIAQTMALAFDCSSELVITLNGLDITQRITSESVGNAASIIASNPEVRRALVQKQKDFKQAPGLVADGRDMGTVIFPEAQYKVFLTASSSERAERRYKQLKEKEISANLAEITAEIEQRDRRDSERKTAPLIMASDALYIDSTNMALQDVITEVLKLIQ